MGYLDFENAEFYRDPEHFDVKKWWIVAAAVAAAPVVFSFLVAPVLISKPKPLWQEPQDPEPVQTDEEVAPLLGAFPMERLAQQEVIKKKADMDWVAY